MKRPGAGRRPQTTLATQQIIRETTDLKRHYGPKESQRLGLPTIEQIAAKYFITRSVVLRIASRARPYKHVHPSDAAGNTGATP